MGNKVLKLREKGVMAGKNARLLELEGALDSVTAAELDHALSSLANINGQSLLVDCAGLSYLNTLGLVTLMKHHMKAKRRGGSLKLFNVAKNIVEVMDISGALKLLDVYNTQEDALNSLGNK